ncbi:MAG: LamG domain-containing protein [Candidatus Sumerlaeia bacterium]|nr:LamG domain-containing protein [Candidatus Sumerlaeia bacterium]
MKTNVSILVIWLLGGCLLAAGESNGWWNEAWRFRTTVVRPTPYRDDAPRPVEVVVDFPLLLQQAGIKDEFDPQSLRVVARGAGGAELVPFACRSELNAREGRHQTYLAWIAKPMVGSVGEYDIYFNTMDRKSERIKFDETQLPPENLLVNPDFETSSGILPEGWTITPAQLVRLGRFAHTSGKRSLMIVVDETTPNDTPREVIISQKIEVRKFAGQEMLFECDLMAERAIYGAPVSIELEQYRADGSRILEYAVQPRWLTLELAQGQLVQFSQRGRFSPETAHVNLRIRMRCYVTDENTSRRVEGPDSYFTIWLDRLVVRPGERWPWPAASHAGFVDGALKQAPLNRGFEFTGLRRLAFNGGSEGTLTAGQYDPDPRAFHWGLQAGTLEFWCRPKWNADDGNEHVFFEGVAYGHRVQSRFRKLDSRGGNRLEFSIADAAGNLHTVRGAAPLRAGQWHHLAATWDFPKAHLQLFVDGQPVAAEGPGRQPWPFSSDPRSESGLRGIGMDEGDRRSLPMQAYVGGDRRCGEQTSAEAVLDELCISDTARYDGPFTPSDSEYGADENTRALFHFENELHGVHTTGDRFVFGHLACEMEPYRESAPLEMLDGGKSTAREVVVKSYASQEKFEKNRVENRMTVYRPQVTPPDPRFVVHLPRQTERTITGTGSGDEFTLEVGGDFEPLMQTICYEHSDASTAKTTLLAHWRANDNVVPLSVRDLAATLAPNAKNDAERAFETFKYALATTNYYDADYSEFLPNNRRRAVDYTLIKALNIYPFNQCGPMNHMLRKMFLCVGISSNDAPGTHHQFEQAFYQGDMRLFDLSPRLYWLLRDNETVASRRDFESDLYLKLRQGTEVNSALPGRPSRASFGTAVRPHSMDFPLRPGERACFAWHNEGRWFEGAGNRQGQPVPLAKIPPYFGNGAIVFEPTAGSPAMRLDNMQIETPAGKPVTLRPKDPAKTASLEYEAQCPYIFSDAVVHGTVVTGKPHALRFRVSQDEGKNWKDVWSGGESAGPIHAALGDQVVGRYQYRLRLEIAAGSGVWVSGLQVRTVFVASPLALPGQLTLGRNRIRFVGGPVSSPLKSICRWVERHRSDLGVSLNTVSYYMNGDQAHRNLLIVRPGNEAALHVALKGRQFSGKVAIEGLPDGWTARSDNLSESAASRPPQSVPSFQFTLRPGPVEEGQIRAVETVLRESGQTRRIPVQVLIADSPLVREAENADEISGWVEKAPRAELSGACGTVFRGQGRLHFDFLADRAGDYALWLRARWEPDSSTAMDLTLDSGRKRNLRAMAMIGFTDWDDPDRAHTKMFAFYGEQFAHWSWYRIGNIHLEAGNHRLTLAADSGAWFDALVVLPQNPTMDRTAMNLFQNWNYAPWNNAL